MNLKNKNDLQTLLVNRFHELFLAKKSTIFISIERIVFEIYT